MNKSMLARDAACNAIVKLVDTSSTSYAWPSGKIYIYNDASMLVSCLPMSNPAFQDSTGGIAYAYPITDATVYMDATVSWFSVMNRDQTSVWTGTIQKNSLVGGDMKFDSIVFPKDSTVSISSGSYSVPA